MRFSPFDFAQDDPEFIEGSLFSVTTIGAQSSYEGSHFGGYCKMEFLKLTGFAGLPHRTAPHFLQNNP
jgi:hypothetical protein